MKLAYPSTNCRYRRTLWEVLCAQIADPPRLLLELPWSGLAPVGHRESQSLIGSGEKAAMLGASSIAASAQLPTGAQQAGRTREAQGPQGVERGSSSRWHRVLWPRRQNCDAASSLGDGCGWRHRPGAVMGWQQQGDGGRGSICSMLLVSAAA